MTNKAVKSELKGKQFTGVVKTIGMQKTVVVAVLQLHRHPLYRKSIRRTQRFAAHNEQFELAVGDRVNIVETKPMSKTKHFLVTEKLSK